MSMVLSIQCLKVEVQYVHAQASSVVVSVVVRTHRMDSHGDAFRSVAEPAQDVVTALECELVKYGDRVAAETVPVMHVNELLW